jgi:hypothetical protein
VCQAYLQAGPKRNQPRKFLLPHLPAGRTEEKPTPQITAGKPPYRAGRGEASFAGHDPVGRRLICKPPAKGFSLRVETALDRVRTGYEGERNPKRGLVRQELILITQYFTNDALPFYISFRYL